MGDPNRVLFFTLMGAYIGQNNATELLLLVGFEICATALKFADYPLAPLLIRFILGGMLEEYIFYLGETDDAWPSSTCRDTDCITKFQG